MIEDYDERLDDDDRQQMNLDEIIFELNHDNMLPDEETEV